MDEMKVVGHINLGKEVIVSDPCYETGIWCQGELDIKPGKYQCAIAYNEDGRVSRVEIRHVDFKNVAATELIKDFVVGVDSGMAGFFDSEYWKSAKSTEDKAEEWYDKICEVVDYKTDRFAIYEDKCFVSLSGYGDGGYECFYGAHENGIVSIKIDFLPDIHSYDDLSEE